MATVVINLFTLMVVLATVKCLRALPRGGVSERPTLKLPLSGQPNDWIVVNSNRSVSVPATVPGTVYTDLMRARVIGDPYARFNDVRYRWVALDNWTYTRTFNVSEAVMSRRTVLLDCSGLDTVASVYLNTRLVLSTWNMFRRFEADVKDALKVGLNRLTVAFTSPVTWAAHQAASARYTVPPVCPPDGQHGECHVNFLRKEASSFSWDWGPAFPTVGIWKPLYLRAYDTVSVHELTAVTMKDADGLWHVTGTLFFYVSSQDGSDATEVTAHFSIPSLMYRKVMANISSNQAQLKYDIIVNGAVSLWWPHTHGSPSLYNLTVSVRTHAGREQLVRRVGFRTVELVQEPIPSAPGLSFFFRVNGHMMFMKGSNWIPADSFQERIPTDYIRLLLTSARDAHMNMLRVWGGGIYERDSFYDIADELGILIWQDLMFACSMYPTDTDFLTNVQVEVTQQVRHLMSHASIAIWSGNNENEAALAKNWYNTTTNYTQYYMDYVKLYIETLRPLVQREDPSRDFISSSPTNGVESEAEGWVAKDPYSNHYGDVHYYNYTADSWRWQSYPVPRFMSEYGVQAWCSQNALKPVTEPGDLIVNSTFYQHRQHMVNGNTVLETSTARHLPLSRAKSPEKYFKHFIYLTQIDQAMAIQTESELLRRSQSDLNAQGDGHTMGALYWQLNDIWQAPTWSSIEYSGKWKMLHHFAVRFFSRTILSPYLEGKQLVLYYIQDPLPAEPTKADKRSTDDNRTKKGSQNRVKMTASPSEPDQVFIMRCYSYTSLKPLMTWVIPFVKPVAPSGRVYEADLAALLDQAGCQQVENCLLHFSLHSDTTAPDTILLPAYPSKATVLQNPHIQVTGVVRRGSHPPTYQISLSTGRPALFVWLDIAFGDARFSDNGFAMLNHTCTVMMTLHGDAPAGVIQSQLTVTSLADVLQQE